MEKVLGYAGYYHFSSEGNELIRTKLDFSLLALLMMAQKLFVLFIGCPKNHKMSVFGRVVF